MIEQMNFFQSLLSRHRNGLETLMKASHITFDRVHLLYYKCHETNLKQGGSYIDSTD